MMKQKIPMYAYVAIAVAAILILGVFLFAEPREPTNIAGEAFKFSQKSEFVPIQKAEAKYEYKIPEKDPLMVENNKDIGSASVGVIGNNPAPSVTCADTDGGINIAIPGRVIIKSNGQTITSEKDECNGNVLTEFYCAGNTGNEYSTKQFITCNQGCTKGACINNTHRFTAYSVQGSLSQAEISYEGQQFTLGGTSGPIHTLPTGERFILMGTTNSSVDFFFENVCSNVDRANITVQSQGMGNATFYENVVNRGVVNGNSQGTLSTGEVVRVGSMFYQLFAGGLTGSDFTITCN